MGNQFNSSWIWLPEWNSDEETEATFVCFRKKISFESIPESFPVKISADSKYKLYINGRLSEVGPSKGDDKIWFYDLVETAPYLLQGENIWTVIVLHYPQDKETGNYSTFRTSTPGLFLESIEKNDETGHPVLSADNTWDACLLSGIKIVSENPFFAPLQIYEKVSASENLWDWKKAVVYKESELSEVLKKRNLIERTIPFMRRMPRTFCGISKVVKSSYGEEEWLDFLNGKRNLEISENEDVCVELDAGELMTGYLHLDFTGGKRAEITLLQSEGYVVSAPEHPKDFDDMPVKGNRSDAINGVLAGYTDTYIASGKGNEDHHEVYEPFWFRTFRYIRFHIRTKDCPLILRSFSYQETGYPLEIQSNVKTSAPVLKDIWDISERTLRRCMHETYMDCPFYEQLQYIMDGRSQILYTYASAADDRLARKCMDDLSRSQNEEGLLNACYPSVCENIIPGFSIYFIGMVYDHMMYFGDVSLVKEYLPTISKILGFFKRHLDERGILEKVGGLNHPENYWSFIDWTPEWKETNGVPSVTLEGPLTMESLLYLLGLQYAEALCRFVKEGEMADSYSKDAEKLKKALRAYCRGKDGMFRDGPSYEAYSQHCQVFAVLTGTVSMEEGKKYLIETLKHNEDYAQCSVAMMYYLFRALEQCGAYEYTEQLWDSWKIMLENHMTTCAEDPLQSRSDCHAWGSLALYELPSAILGLRPTAPGYSEAEIRPHAEYLSEASGVVMTPVGKVKISWEREDDVVYLKTDKPEVLKVNVNSDEHIIIAK